MNIKEATERACQEPTLVDALSWICVWESERVVRQAAKQGLKGIYDADGKGWDTCFKFCIEHVMEYYKGNKMSELKLNFEDDEQRLQFVAWFADGGGENDYWNFYEYRDETCPVIELIFKDKIVEEINFKVIEENE